MNEKPASAILWSRLDRPGHDHCRLYRLADGWRVEGTAVFLERQPCSLRYEVQVSRDWITRRATVDGFLGNMPVALRIQATRPGRWRVNGAAQPQLDGCLDLDLAFTPATNLMPLKRLALKVGSGVTDAPAAYLAFPRLAFIVLPQTYARVSALEYDYTSPTHGYAARLQLTRDGWVARYPGVFERVDPRAS